MYGFFDVFDEYNDEQYTLPFYALLNENNVLCYPPSSEFKTLFPANYPESISAAITQHFYYRQIGFYIPQKFLRKFHYLLNERKEAWLKLITSEELVKPDQATKNYDMTEERTSNVNTTSNSHSSTDSESTDGIKSVVTSKSGATAWVSDTPDGSVDDIEHYMSSANKNSSDSTVDTTGENTSSSVGNNNISGMSKGDSTETIKRSGNIGVTTFEKIIEGYRNSIKWCAFEEVVFPEIEPLFFGLM